MKKLILTLSLMTVLGTATATYAQRHRHNPQTILQATATDTAAITAFSDTTGMDTGAAQAGNDDTDEDRSSSGTNHFDSGNDPFTLIGYLPSIGIGGTIVAIFFVLLCLLVACSPFILIGTIIYMQTKRKNKRYEIIEKAIEKGHEIPQELIRPDEYTNEAMWKKGIKNICVGIGLIFLFGIMGASPLTGIGCLVALYGVGQAVISKTVRNRNSGDGRHTGGDGRHTGDNAQDMN